MTGRYKYHAVGGHGSHVTLCDRMFNYLNFAMIVWIRCKFSILFQREATVFCSFIFESLIAS